MYFLLAMTNNMSIDLSFKVHSLIFGDAGVNNKIIEDLRPFNPDVEKEISPFKFEKSTENDHFKAFYSLRVFPIEFKSDFHDHFSKYEQDDSFDYSITKKLKLINEKVEASDLAFQMEFMPVVRVYHLKKRSLRMWIFNILAVCGGVFGLAGIINKFFNF
jgi:Endoplasmic reticulum vesicle transporter